MNSPAAKVISWLRGNFMSVDEVNSFMVIIFETRKQWIFSIEDAFRRKA